MTINPTGMTHALIHEFICVRNAQTQLETRSYKLLGVHFDKYLRYKANMYTRSMFTVRHSTRKQYCTDPRPDFQL